jgi:phenylacetate-coenzyme A ligase PaaK-like adenylate-forming protein
VGLSGEPLHPESRVLMERAFGAPVSESWGSTETGPLSFGALGQPMRLHEPAAVVEPVDAGHRACDYGERSASTLVTNVVNKVLPLIRYELGDEIVLEPPQEGDGAGGPVVSEVRGRDNDTFVYEGGTVVHPAAMEQLFGTEPSAVDYQVCQTRSGVEVRLCTSDGHDDDETVSRVRRRIEGILAAAGLPAADVHLERVDEIDRLASGKVKRFVALR